MPTKTILIAVFKSRSSNNAPYAHPDAPPHVFYVQISQNHINSCWYTNRLPGHTTFGQTVSKLCKGAGFEGFQTNHSLRATATSRFYHAGVEEQLVMEVTGHHSVEGACSYK